MSSWAEIQNERRKEFSGIKFTKKVDKKEHVSTQTDNQESKKCNGNKKGKIEKC